MRQTDGSDLLGANDPRGASTGIIYVAPGDDRSSVLEAILMQDKLGRHEVAVVLPENNRAFQRATDFDGLKNLRRGLKTEIIFVIPGAPGTADFARQRRFTVYTSLDNYTSALRAGQSDNGNGNAKKMLPLFNRRPKLVPNANAPEPLESFDEPVPLPPAAFVAPVISPGATSPAVPFDDAEVSTMDEPAPGESFAATGGANAAGANPDTEDDEWVQPSAAAQQNGVPYAAPIVPVPVDEDAEPLSPRSKSGPIPIPIALPQTGAATKPLTPGARGSNGSASSTRSGTTGKQAAIGAAAVGAGAAAAFAAASRTPVAGGGQPPIRGNASGSGGGGGGRGPRRRSTRRLLALLLVLLTLLLLAGIAFASPPGQKLIGNITSSTITATVTITPKHSTVSDSFVVTAVTGTPNPAAQQVQARVVSYTSPSQSASANATGSLPGANATGTLTFLNTGFSGITISGATLTGRSGVPVFFNGPVFIPASSSVPVRGTAVNPGVAGDIPRFDIAYSCCGSSSILVRNTTAFSGGQDPIPNSVITQKDITTASNNLISKLKPSAQAALQQQLKPNEAAVSSSLNCTTNVTANHHVGDQAKSVTVSGTATCTEVAYDQKGALTLASNALKAEAAKNPGAGYALVGNVVTSITSATVINKQNTVSLVILAQGVWVYQFTDALKTALKNKLAKEAQSTAQTDVNGTTGVMSATISISSGNTMPDAADITINIVSIPGLSGSPTPTTTPPSGTTPTSVPTLTPTNGLGGS